MTKKLKILFISFSYPDEDDPTNGIFVHEHARAVSTHNPVVVLHAKPAITSTRSVFQVSNRTKDGIRVIRVHYQIPFFPSLVSYLLACLVGFRYLSKQGYRPDLIHAHFFAAGLPAILIGRLYNLPVVISEHWSGFPLRTLNWHGVLLAKFVMSRASFVCPVTDNLRKHIQSFGINARFKTVPNTINLNIFKPATLNLCSNRRKKILFVGRIVPVKGLDYLLEALALLIKQRNDFQLDIVGDGTSKEYYQMLVKQLGLNNFVFFHGTKNKIEVAEFMNASDFLVLPSIWENQPNVLLEAMSCGKPVIATTVGGVPEMVCEKTGVLVEPEDVSSLYVAIKTMMERLDFYDSKMISSFVSENFSHNVVGQELDCLYRRSLVECLSTRCCQTALRTNFLELVN